MGIFIVDDVIALTKSLDQKTLEVAESMDFSHHLIIIIIQLLLKMSSLAQFFETRNSANANPSQEKPNLHMINLFSERKENPVVEIKKVKKNPISDSNQLNSGAKQSLQPQKENEKMVDEEAEDLEATVFVGNVALETNHKKLKNYFSSYGSVLKVWFRSIPVEESKLPKKAKHILKKYQEGADSMNAYVKFSKVEEANAACSANGCEFEGKNIKVTMCNDFSIDYDSTIFIGNLPKKVKDQQVWDAFKHIGKILNVRIIREKFTMEGIGIGYVRFESKEEMKRAISEMNGKKIHDREMRIKKAVPKERLEKKVRKMQARKLEKAQGIKRVNKNTKQPEQTTGKGTKVRDQNNLQHKTPKQPFEQKQGMKTKPIQKDPKNSFSGQRKPFENNEKSFNNQRSFSNDKKSFNNQRSSNNNGRPFKNHQKKPFEDRERKNDFGNKDRGFKTSDQRNESFKEKRAEKIRENSDSLNIKGAKQMKKKIVFN